MSTRSLIGKLNKDGSVKYIYCQHDGYLEGVGKTLVDFYDENNIDELLDLGDLSSLGNNPVSDKRAWNDFGNISDEFCIAYKDRGENTPSKTVNSIEEYLNLDCWQEFSYLLVNGIWYYVNNYEDQDIDLTKIDNWHKVEEFEEY